MLFELPRIKHLDAETVQEALGCLKAYGGKARVIAGATDLLGMMKDHIEGPKLRSPEVLVNIKTIPEVTGISFDEETGLRIGAAVTLHQLVESEVVRQRCSILSQAALSVGTTQLRNVGTVGGNLCQRPRCAYFRHPHFVCIKKGGKTCYAIAGEHRFYHSIFEIGKCVAAHPSDLATALVALEAVAVIVAPEGERKVPLKEFFLGPENLGETILEPDELLLAVEVPCQPAGISQVFLKRRIRRSADWALVSVAAVARMSEEICEKATLVLGGVAPSPYLAVKAGKRLRGSRLTEPSISEAAEAAVAGAHPLRMNGYKVPLAKALVRRALTSLV